MSIKGGRGGTETKAPSGLCRFLRRRVSRKERSRDRYLDGKKGGGDGLKKGLAGTRGISDG